MSFNTALLNGDMKEVNNLLEKGYSWVGSKSYFDRQKINFPTDPELFSQYIRYILDNEFTDFNFGRVDSCFTWFTSPKRFEVEQMLQLLPLDDKYSRIFLEVFLFAYLKAFSLYENELLNCLTETEKSNCLPPQIKISGTKGRYNLLIEAYSYPNCDVWDILDLNLDTNTLDSLLRVMSFVRFYTC